MALSLAASAWDVVTDKPSASENTAATELRTYLERAVPSGDVTVGGKVARFFVGDSKAANGLGWSVQSLPEEEWHVKALDDGSVVIIGGGSRGTLYAAYHFLEDKIGVRWWTFSEEDVPSLKSLDLKGLEISGRPFFRQRDIYRCRIKHDGGRFYSRLRLNRDGDYPTSMEYGGNFTFGPPQFVHTFAPYFPEKDYFKDHPEWYALRDGKRSPSATNSQLCLSNREMRKELYKRLQEFIAKGEATAKEKNLAPPRIYDFSANDCRNPCQCDDCQAIVRREGSEAGPLLECLNEIADRLAKERPDLMLSTLAYYHTETPPKHIRPAENIIIRLCDTGTDKGTDFNAPQNQKFVNLLKGWAKLTKHLAVWEYSITYMQPTGPFPREFHLGQIMRTFADNNVKYFMFEHEGFDSSDIYAMSLWMEAKLLENPYADSEALRKEFLNGYYRASAPYIDSYRRLLLASTNIHATYIDWFNAPGEFTMVDAPTAIAASAMMDKAEAAVAENPALLARVRRARLNLDRIIALNWRIIVQNFVDGGNAPTAFPIDHDALLKRVRATWSECIPQMTSQDAVRNQMNSECARTEKFTYMPCNPPAAFAGRDYIDFLMEACRTYNGRVVVTDTESEAGSRVTVTDAKAISLPLEAAMYVTESARTNGVGSIRREDIKGPGYHWYKLFETTPEPTAFIYILNDWTIQFHLASRMHALQGRRFEVWFNVKFDGPDYPFGNPDSPNSVSVSRMLLVPKK